MVEGTLKEKIYLDVFLGLSIVTLWVHTKSWYPRTTVSNLCTHIIANCMYMNNVYSTNHCNAMQRKCVVWGWSANGDVYYSLALSLAVDFLL